MFLISGKSRPTPIATVEKTKQMVIFVPHLFHYFILPYTSLRSVKLEPTFFWLESELIQIEKVAYCHICILTVFIQTYVRSMKCILLVDMPPQ